MSKEGLHAKEVATLHSGNRELGFLPLAQAGMRCYLCKCSYGAMKSNLLFDFVHYSTFIVLNIMDHLLKLSVRHKIKHKLSIARLIF